MGSVERRGGGVFIFSFLCRICCNIYFSEHLWILQFGMSLRPSKSNTFSPDFSPSSKPMHSADVVVDKSHILFLTKNDGNVKQAGIVPGLAQLCLRYSADKEKAKRFISKVELNN